MSWMMQQMGLYNKTQQEIYTLFESPLKEQTFIKLICLLMLFLREEIHWAVNSLRPSRQF